jgi:hypothetical protein
MGYRNYKNFKLALEKLGLEESDELLFQHIAFAFFHQFLNVFLNE